MSVLADYFAAASDDAAATLLAALTDLARQAGGRGERLYCRYVF